MIAPVVPEMNSGAASFKNLAKYSGLVQLTLLKFGVERIRYTCSISVTGYSTRVEVARRVKTCY